MSQGFDLESFLKYLEKNPQSLDFDKRQRIQKILKDAGPKYLASLPLDLVALLVDGQVTSGLPHKLSLVSKSLARQLDALYEKKLKQAEIPGSRERACEWFTDHGSGCAKVPLHSVRGLCQDYCLKEQPDAWLRPYIVTQTSATIEPEDPYKIRDLHSKKVVAEWTSISNPESYSEYFGLLHDSKRIFDLVLSYNLELWTMSAKTANKWITLFSRDAKLKIKSLAERGGEGGHLLWSGKNAIAHVQQMLVA